jgi:hypothetical protein
MKAMNLFQYYKSHIEWSGLSLPNQNHLQIFLVPVSNDGQEFEDYMGGCMISDDFEKMDGYLPVCKLSDVDEWKLKRQGKAADVKSEETKIYMLRDYWRHYKEDKEDVLKECRVYRDLMSRNVAIQSCLVEVI